MSRQAAEAESWLLRLPGRLGFGAPQAAEPAFALRLLVALLAIYALGFALFYPRVAVNDDEAQYLRQARMIVDGRSTISQENPIDGEILEVWPSTYPPGIAATMAPFVALAGWRGAYVVPLLGLVLAVLMTALWLREAGRPPIFALLVLGFAPTLMMARVAMSDVPSAGVVALGLWLFWRGLRGGVGWWIAAGFVAGSSLVYRVSNPLVFAPLFAGTVLRRDPNWWALVVGGVAGLALRVASMMWYFGDPFFERSYYFFALETLPERLPYYLLGLLVLAPGGIVFGYLYRGPRRPEILITLTLFLAFYVFQGFSTSTTGVAKRVVLTLRYIIPLMPLLAFAMAESVPRLWQRAHAARQGDARRRLVRATGLALAVGLGGVGLASAAVHPAFHLWGATQASIRDEIARHVPVEAVMVTNKPATRKFLPVLERRFRLVRRAHVEPADLTEMVGRYGELYLVLLDRSDSEIWREDAQENAAFVAGLEIEPELLTDRQMSFTDHLRIWRLRAPQAAGRPAAGSPTASQ